MSDEGLPLSLHRPQDVAFDPARCMGEALRLAPGQHPTDAIFALDADPLPRRTSPDVLREAIARLPPGAPGDLRAALAASAYGSGARCPDAALPAQVHHPVPAHAEWRWPELPGIDRLQAALHETDRPVDADAR